VLVAYAYGFMRYGENGLWVGQFVLFLSSGAVAGGVVGWYWRRWKAMGIGLAIVIVAMEILNQWTY